MNNGRAVLRTVIVAWTTAALSWTPVVTARSAEAPAVARVTIELEQSGATIDGLLWGSNLLNTAPAAATVDNPDFVAAARQMGIRIVRWPGGNQGDIFDWKRNEIVNPGRRVPLQNGVPLLNAARFCEAIEAELSITVNFGTMNARDAADLVEFCNGPTNTTWGAERARRGHPAPLDVRFWEIGNEENQPHMWHFAWTAENPEKYFFGGDEERRGTHPPTRQDPYGLKGDSFGADGGPGQTYRLRFPPVRDARVLVATNRQAALNRQFTRWFEVPDLAAQPPDAEVFTVEEETGTIRFGDGVHGARPSAESFFLVEYTTYGHDGYVAFAQAMRAAPSSVPIRIGAATLPFVDGRPLDISDAQMNTLLDQMDFHVNHHYNAGFDYSTYGHRRQIAWERTQPGVHGRFANYVRSLGRDRVPDLAVTEWNIFLNMDVWQLNRTLEGAVIAAEYFARVLNAGPELPIVLAHQFALHGGALALYHTQIFGSIAPMGYVFEGFAPWVGAIRLPVTVDSPGAVAFDQDLPFIQAAAARSPDGSTLHLVLSNNAETAVVSVQIAPNGGSFSLAPGLARRLEGETAAANNERDPKRVILRDAPLAPAPDGTINLLLAPHSVVFLELPLSAGPRFTGIERLDNDRLEVRWELPPDGPYRLEQSANFADWSTVIEDLAPFGGRWILRLPPTSGARWFRIAR